MAAATEETERNSGSNSPEPTVAHASGRRWRNTSPSILPTAKLSSSFSNTDPAVIIIIIHRVIILYDRDE